MPPRVRIMGGDDNPKIKTPSAQLGWAGLTGSYYTIIVFYAEVQPSQAIALLGKDTIIAKNNKIIVTTQPNLT